MMKRIIYETQEQKVVVVGPFEGARLAIAVALRDGTVLSSDKSMPADRFLRRWPVEGAVATWSESEDAFLQRIADSTVPSSAKRVAIVNASQIPADRSRRDSWTFDEIVGARVL
jgi:hypothetical protein